MTDAELKERLERDLELIIESDARIWDELDRRFRPTMGELEAKRLRAPGRIRTIYCVVMRMASPPELFGMRTHEILGVFTSRKGAELGIRNLRKEYSYSIGSGPGQISIATYASNMK